MLDVRRLTAILSCVTLLAFPVAAGAQQEQDQQPGGTEEPAGEPEQVPAAEPAKEPAKPAEKEEPAKKEEPAREEKPAKEEEPAREERPAAREEAGPYEKPEKSWISLSGTVAESDRDRFTLDYGEGLIVVEMDGRELFDRTNRIMPGERVRVYGEINDDLYRRRVIDADSIYVFDRQSFYFPEARKTEAVYFLTGDPGDLPEGTWVSVSGIVKEIDGREFTLDTGIYDIEVDTDELGYNPLDDVGLQRINVGDRVYVSGPLDDQFFEDNEILAQTVMTISPGISLLQEE